MFNGKKFEYDEIGNPLIYKDINLSWSRGRQLDKFSDNISYTYNINGIRTSKTVDGITTKFYLNGTQIIKQTDGTNDLEFYYGIDGVVGFNLNGDNFTYKKSIQGDIIGIINSNGIEICKYVYDAWGNQKRYILSNTSTYIEYSDKTIYRELENEIKGCSI